MSKAEQRHVLASSGNDPNDSDIEFDKVKSDVTESKPRSGLLKARENEDLLMTSVYTSRFREVLHLLSLVQPPVHSILSILQLGTS